MINMHWMQISRDSLIISHMTDLWLMYLWKFHCDLYYESGLEQDISIEGNEVKRQVVVELPREE